MVKTLPAVACRALTMTMALVSNGYVVVMLVTNHVLSGALIGGTVRRPLPAAALGVASHFALDAVPHWGRFESGSSLLRVAVPDGLAGLAVIGAFAAFAPRERRLAVLAGMAGAAFPDLDKPSLVFFGRSPFPRAWDAFHAAIQDEAPDRVYVEIAAAAILAAGALTVLRKRERS
jgi:hypothetical protein